MRQGVPANVFEIDWIHWQSSALLETFNLDCMISLDLNWIPLKILGLLENYESCFCKEECRLMSAERKIAYVSSHVEVLQQGLSTQGRAEAGS